jgi:hypothetical protein
VRSLIALPQAITGEVEVDAYRSLAGRDLQRGNAYGLPSSESVARAMGETPLSPDETALGRAGWSGDTPLWLYVLIEAEHRGGGALAREASAECETGKPGAASHPGPIVHYARWMSPPATLVMWFQLRSPKLAEDFERLMAEDRDIVRGSLDTVSDWRLTRPADVPGQAIGQADYVLIAEIAEVERFEQQASEHVERLADDLAHLVSSRGMLVVRPVL